MWLSRRARCHSRAPVLVEEPPTAPVLTQISPRPLALSESLFHCTCVSQEVRVTLGLWSRIHVVILPCTPGAPEKQGGVSQLHITSQRPPQASWPRRCVWNWWKPSAERRRSVDVHWPWVWCFPRGSEFPSHFLLRQWWGGGQSYCFLCLFLKCHALLGEGNFTR